MDQYLNSSKKSKQKTKKKTIFQILNNQICLRELEGFIICRRNLNNVVYVDDTVFIANTKGKMK